MNKKPTLSIIIPLRNTREYHRDIPRLGHCLESLARQTVLDKLEIIVADLGSDTYYRRKHTEIIKTSALGTKCRHIYVKHEGDWNISKARNVGLRAARGEYVCATDVDCIFAPDFFDKLLAEINGDKIVHCLIRDLPRDYAGVLDDWPAMTAASTQRPAYCYGGCQAVSRKWAESIHGWDEKYRHWGADDTDFKERAKIDGKNAVWLEALYFHQWHQQDNRIDDRPQVIRNRARYKLTETRQLPLIRNPFEWGGEPAKSVDDTAVIITTFMRDDMLFRAIKLIRKFHPDMAIFVADNGNPTDEKTQFCDDYEAIIIQLPFDSGVGTSRNRVFERLPANYKYVVIMEDDIHLLDDMTFSSWRRLLNHDKYIVVAGGCLRRVILGSNDVAEQHYEANIELDREAKTFYVREIEKPEFKDGRGIRYMNCDIILNCFMMKRYIWDEGIKWDEQIKSAPEHCDWFLTLKEKAPTYKVAYCPDAILEHVKNPIADAAGTYMSYRSRQDGYIRFADKWGIDWMWSSWHPRYNLPNPMNLREQGRGADRVMTENLRTAIDILKAHKCAWWLEAGTCLGAVRERGFIEHDPDIDLGLLAPSDPGKYDALKEDFIERGFTIHREWEYDGRRVELSMERAGVKVDLFFFFESEKRPDILWHGAFGPGAGDVYDVFLPHVFSKGLFEKLQEINFRGMTCHVPNPPEQYLAERYGPDWKISNKGYIYWRDCRAIDRAFFKPNAEVFVGGVWDLLHQGHINILARARALGRVTAGVLTDEAAEKYKSPPIVPFNQRILIVGALKYVDQAIEQRDQDPTNDLQELGYIPDYIIHGDDWVAIPGADYVQAHGGRTVFFPYTPGVSTMEIRRRVIERGIDEPANRTKGAGSEEDRIAIGIKTFYREETLWRTLAAIEKYCPYPYRLYIADDGPLSDGKKYRYQELERKGHKVFRLPFNSGISIGRNAIARAVGEDYILVSDDDIALTDTESLKMMRRVLDYEPDMGVVAAVIRDESNGAFYATEEYAKGIAFNFRDTLLARVPASHTIYSVNGDKGPRFTRADQVPNFFLAKRDVLQDVRWDDRIRVEYEHLDWFLALRKTKWKAAVCLDANAAHLRSDPERDYVTYRRTYSPAYFLQKNGLTSFVNQF